MRPPERTIVADTARPTATFHTLRAKSGAMVNAFAMLARAAPMQAPVLLEGERGTGKETLARAVHASSPRRDGPFITPDAPALGAALDGAIEAARGGTLFVDEVGDLPPVLQAELLYALEDKSRDVRIVCATSRTLKAEVLARRFSGELLQRLCVLRVRVPPLRERGDDLALLVEDILAALGRDDAIADDVLERLAHHPWAGNVRELKSTLERAVANADGDLDTAVLALVGAPLLEGVSMNDGEPVAIELDDLLHRPYREARAEMLARFEAAYLREGLKRHGGNVSGFARASGIARNYVHKLMRRSSVKRWQA